MAQWSSRERALAGGLAAAAAVGYLTMVAFRRVVDHVDDGTKHPTMKIEALEARLNGLEKEVERLKATREAEQSAAEENRKRTEQQNFWREQRKEERAQLEAMLRQLLAPQRKE